MNAATFFEQDHFLENDRARLEPLTEKHFSALLPIGLEKEIWEFTSIKVTNEQDFRRYFDDAIAEKKASLSYPFAIYDKQSGQYAGCTRYGNISFMHKRLEIGWTWYKPALQRSGINKAAKSLLLTFAFDVLRFNRIELKTSAKNIKSQGAMLKIGAVKEGVFRNHMINDDGTIRDSVYFSFINEDWPGIKKNIFGGDAAPNK